MSTMVLNRTDILIKIMEAFEGVIRFLRTLRPGEKNTFAVDPHGTFIQFLFERDRENGFGGERRSTYYIALSSDDWIDWESIDLVPRGHDATEFEWKGITPRTSSEFRTAWKNAFRKVEAVARFSEKLEKDLKRVVIYRAQCAHLVRFCSVRVQKIRDIFPPVSDLQVFRFYRRVNFEILTTHLNDLLRALLLAQKLLKGCGQKEWRKAVLVLSLPPPDPQNLEKYSGSKFALVIRELGWSFDLFQFEMVRYFRDEFKFNWDDGRDRYVLQGDQLENGVADDEMELLEGDRDREILDHKELLSDLENGLIVRDNSSIALADRWSKFSHQDFAETIKNRCRKQTIQNWCRKEDFDIDDSDLQKKKSIGRGGFKVVHKGKWLRLKVAIATFELQGNTSEGIECEDVEKEARFMVTLQHPNVVEFYG